VRAASETISGMASLVWLIVWITQGTPNLEWFGSWNDWSVALLGCVIFDVFGGREVVSRRTAENPQARGG
jgi:hypothetical protein